MTVESRPVPGEGRCQFALPSLIPARQIVILEIELRFYEPCFGLSCCKTCHVKQALSEAAMVIKWLDTQGPTPPFDPPKLRAAKYVRMSTEHQKYSTDNQSSAIQKYADQRGYEIVRTYADEGKSGLNIGGRLGLQSLLEDVEAGEADFEALLVYDVSRWGRFQDPDEAASYELRCRRAGVQVHYCAEQFENDGSIGWLFVGSNTAFLSV